MRLPTALAAALLALATPAAAVPFGISDSYSASTALLPGTYACRSGLDFNSFTYTFDLEETRYSVRGLDNPDGTLAFDADGTLAFDAEGNLTFLSGPFAPDDTATMHGRATLRVSDGNPVIILGYFFTDGADSYDYCARLD